MKRSDVIILIQKTWDKQHQDMYMNEYVADMILRELEKAGISPPDDQGIVFGWNEGYISPPEWEKED